MTDNKQIHDFTKEWCIKFKDKNISYMKLVDHFMADDSNTLK